MARSKAKKAGAKAGAKKVGKPKASSRSLLKATPGNHAKVRHMRDRKGHLHAWEGRLPTGLVAKPIVAQPKSKHRSYFEFVENREKKKKLEFKVAKEQSGPRLAEHTISPVYRSQGTKSRHRVTNLFL